jgi:hypothetical protein
MKSTGDSTESEMPLYRLVVRQTIGLSQRGAGTPDHPADARSVRQAEGETNLGTRVHTAGCR